jgi:hypothetical protein
MKYKKMPTNKIYTTTNYTQKDEVKELGGFYDPNYRRWYFNKVDKNILNHLLKNEILVYKTLTNERKGNRSYKFNELKELYQQDKQPITTLTISDDFLD